MAKLHFLETTLNDSLCPLTRIKSLFEIRLGSRTLGERWCAFDQVYQLPQGTHILNVHPGLVLNSQVIQNLHSLQANQSLWKGDLCVAVASDGESDVDSTEQRSLSADFLVIQTLPDVLKANALCLQEDLFRGVDCVPDMVDLIGDVSRLSLGNNVRIYGRVTINVEDGPVVIDDDAVIKAPSTIEGPAYIGKQSVVNGARIRPCTTIGPVCKIAGEISGSVFESFSNKAHDGFVGDSYIGSWVNLGAMTTTSNLKNTYGTISYSQQDELVDSGCIHLGCFLGDYVTLGIGTLLPSGCVIEPGVNFFGGGQCPKYIPAFVWGTEHCYQEYQQQKMLDVFSMMKERRQQSLSSYEQKQLAELFEQTTVVRHHFLNQKGKDA